MTLRPEKTRAEVVSRTDRVFLHGVLAALAQVKDRNTVLFDEIVSACGGKQLVEEARRSGQMRISGMSDYLRRKS